MTADPDRALGFIDRYEACPLCAGTDLVPDFTIERAGGLLRWSLCRGCDLTFQNPRLDEATLRAIYAGDEYWEGGAYRSYAETEPLRIAQSRRRLRRIRIVSGTARGRLLDVGCATGFFGKVARESGFDVLGIEPSPKMAAYARESHGLEIFRGTLEEWPLERERFDLVTLWGTDSHFLHPLEGFSKLQAALVPRGILAMNYQNFHHWIRRVFPGLKRSWNALYNFSDRSFEVLLEKTGFEILYRGLELQRVSADHLLRVLKLGVPRFVSRLPLLVPALSFSLVIARKIASGLPAGNGRSYNPPRTP